jgi:hypothetical protein
MLLKIKTTDETDFPQTAARDEVQANGRARVMPLAGCTVDRSIGQ